ncbi:molybdate ABC transporter substrate-binding protein [Nigerium massiliense]|uniref:molybdate ABC transporter substrate-binding protein n=1 Tax=Nigerium massiliense TaxID=1522317 RepID=UPI000693A408|nr:molybdate ABC transporter substrate-binding protein [Nigerium massiliense]
MTVCAGLVALLLLVGGCGGPSSQAKTVTVFAEPSLRTVLPRATEVFRQTRTVTQVNAHYDTSDHLVSALGSGQQADVLITADEASMADARRRGLLSTEGVWTIAVDRLVLVVPRGNPAHVSSLADAASAGLAACASAAPCGAAAEALAREDGASLAQAARAASSDEVVGRVAEGKARAGVAYASDARAAGQAVEAVEIPNARKHANRLQAALLAGSTSPGPAEDYVKFLATPQAQTILQQQGFEAP